jgi:hypothetical protein
LAFVQVSAVLSVTLNEWMRKLSCESRPSLAAGAADVADRPEAMLVLALDELGEKNGCLFDEEKSRSRKQSHNIEASSVIKSNIALTRCVFRASTGASERGCR